MAWRPTGYLRDGELGATHSQQGKLWILAVADSGVVNHIRAYKSEAEADKGLVEYLRKYQDYNGKNNVKEAWKWLDEHERLSAEVVQQNINLGQLKHPRATSKTTELARTNSLFEKCSFVVLAKNRHEPNTDAPFEAWAYKGLLDFRSAEPVVFGLGRSCHDALDALDSKLAELKPGGNGSCTECPQ